MRTDVAPAGAVKPVTVGCSVLIAFFRSALSLALLVGCRAMGLSLSSLFTSLSSLVRWSKDQDVRILMLGLDAAGKVRCLYSVHTKQHCSSDHLHMSIRQLFCTVYR